MFSVQVFKNVESYFKNIRLITRVHGNKGKCHFMISVRIILKISS